MSQEDNWSFVGTTVQFSESEFLKLEKRLESNENFDEIKFEKNFLSYCSDEEDEIVRKEEMKEETQQNGDGETETREPLALVSLSSSPRISSATNNLGLLSVCDLSPVFNNQEERRRTTTATCGSLDNNLLGDIFGGLHSMLQLFRVLIILLIFVCNSDFVSSNFRRFWDQPVANGTPGCPEHCVQFFNLNNGLSHEETCGNPNRIFFGGKQTEVIECLGPQTPQQQIYWEDESQQPLMIVVPSQSIVLLFAFIN